MFATASAQPSRPTTSIGLTAPMPISDVQGQVLRLEEATAALEGAVVRLTDRLESVLIPDNAVTADGPRDSVRAVRCGDTALSQQLHCTSSRIENLLARVAEITARLGV